MYIHIINQFYLAVHALFKKVVVNPSVTLAFYKIIQRTLRPMG